jgi:hypothetical protein
MVIGREAALRDGGRLPVQVNHSSASVQRLEDKEGPLPMA